MTDIAALVARLEKATGPDRELDAAVYEASSGLKCTIGGLAAPVTCDADGNELPRYTASLDAALTLVPSGAEWSTEWELEFAEGEYGAVVYGDHLGVPNAGEHCTAATPAIALCIAALRARSAP